MSEYGSAKVRKVPIQIPDKTVESLHATILQLKEAVDRMEERLARLESNG